MVKSEAIWTIIPNGISQDSDGQLKLSIYITPKIHTTPEEDSNHTSILTTTPFSDWPKKINELIPSFSVKFSKHSINGVCPAGGKHSPISAATSETFVLSHSIDLDPNNPEDVDKKQAEWNWCNKCSGLFFSKNIEQSKCPADGTHNNSILESANYVLTHDKELTDDNEVDKWKWCHKCQGLFFNGISLSETKCPADGSTHAILDDTMNYFLSFDPIHDFEKQQEGWLRCGKCHGLYFSQEISSDIISIEVKLDSASMNMDSELWKKLFIKHQCRIKSDKPQESPTQFIIKSFPNSKISKLIETQHMKLATISPLKPPTVSQIVKHSLNSQEPERLFIPFMQIHKDSSVLKMIQNKGSIEIGRNMVIKPLQNIESTQMVKGVMKALNIQGLPLDFLKERKIKEQELKTITIINDDYFASKVLSEEKLQSMEKENPLSLLVVANDFHKLYENHTQKNIPKWIDVKDNQDEKKKQFDDFLGFDEAVTLLSQYPEILRRLGLIVDLMITSENVPPSGSKSPLCLELTSPAFGSQTDKLVNTCSRTFYVFDESKKHFQCASDTSTESEKIIDGMLEFDNEEQYNVLQYDIDNAAIETMNMISRFSLDDYIRTMDVSLSPEDSDLNSISSYYGTKTQNCTLPQLTSGLISVVKTRRSLDYHERIQRLSNQSNLLTSGVWAQDLMRGYAIDIWDSDTQEWHSLCKRLGYYFLGDNPLNCSLSESELDSLPNRIMKFEDEGWVEPTPTQSVDKSMDNETITSLYLHESLFRWHGWSLSVPRLGLSIDPADGKEQSPTEPLSRIKIATCFKPVAHSLPKLRFGRDYKIRARIVDLTGNRIPISEANDKHSTKEVTYSRYEQVSPPIIILHNELKIKNHPGESLDNIVIRSYNYGLEEDSIRTEEKADRHILPPKTSIKIAELHGMFDTLNKENTTFRIKDCHSFKEIYQLIKQKEGAESILERFIDNEFDNRQLVSPPSYPIDRKDQAKIPYLPDPQTAGVSIRNLPGLEIKNGVNTSNSSNKIILGEEGPTLMGMTLNYKEIDFEKESSDVGENIKSITKISFGSIDNWPELKSFRIRVSEPEGDPDPDLKPKWDSIDRILDINLKKGESRKIKLSSFFSSEKELLNMGLWQWMNKSESSKLKAYALFGLHYMLSPYIEIDLVHAVQQPLGEPELELHDATEDTSTLNSLIPFRPLPNMLPHFFRDLKIIIPKSDFAIAANNLSLFMKLNIPCEVIHIKPLDLQTNDDDNFDTSIKPFVHLTGIIKVDVKSTLKVSVNCELQDCSNYCTSAHQAQTAKQSALAFEIFVPENTPDNFVKVDEYQPFPDTKHRLVRYRATAMSRYAEYFPEYQEITITDNGNERTDKIKTPVSRESKSILVHILNRSKPSLPKITQIVPTFQWQQEIHDDTNSIVSIRKLNGIRAYIEGPWFETGCDELLGVILIEEDSLPQGRSIADKEIQQMATYWAADPLFESSDTINLRAGCPPVENFIEQEEVVDLNGEHLESKKHIPLEIKISDSEKFDGKFTVIGYKVQCSPIQGSNKWFSDIAINTHDIYSPLLRLALVRYQPFSIKNKFISDIYTSDILQLLPDRTLTIKKVNEPNSFELKVSVQGPTYRSRIGWNAEFLQEAISSNKEKKDIEDLIKNEKDRGTSESDLFQRILSRIDESSMFEFAIEKLSINDSDLAWGEIDYFVVRETDQEDEICNVSIGSFDVTPGSKLRLVVKEFALLITDSKEFKYMPELLVENIKLGSLEPRMEFNEVKKLIYMDIIELDNFT